MPYDDRRVSIRDDPKFRAGYTDGLKGKSAEYTEGENPLYFLGYGKGRAEFQELQKVRVQMRNEQRLKSGYDDAYRGLLPQATDYYYMTGYFDYYRQHPYQVINPVRLVIWLVAKFMQLTK